MWGTIPPELGNLTFLETLYLFGNQLREEIPPELANLENLKYLGLSGNDLQGEIPPELGNLENLEFLNLSHNELQGEIPLELGNLHSLETLNLSYNKLEGEIPSELENLENLEYLNLANNRLEGILPDFLADFPNLEDLFLNGNTKLNGCLPEGASVPYCTQSGNLNARRENGDTVLTWDPVEGATHYKIYYEDFWGECYVTSGGVTGSFACELLASDIFETTYVHVRADDDALYWVAACNNDGCSPIYRDDPGASP